MEWLQGPLNSCFFGEHLEVNCLEQGFLDTESLRLEEEEQFLISSLDDNMPFLQMLQGVQSTQIFPFKEPSFQTLLRMQHLKKRWDWGGIAQNQTLQFESCVTHDLREMQYSPLGYECNQLLEQPKSTENCGREANGDSPSAAAWVKPQSWHRDTQRRKRKRTRPTKNKEDVENQRMTHIAVERNRRRQMNDHLSVLRSFMPPSYSQRGDHASIIGGAIDFVKELEQLLQSLEAQKRMRKNEEGGCSGHGMSSSTEEPKCGDELELKAENQSDAAEIEVTVIQSHVNLKIQCQRRPEQLVKAISALENLRLTILHLNITSSQASVLYSFNLKIEEDCKLGSANEIAEAVHHIFCLINGS